METLGLIAGSGRFPVLVAQEARRAGLAVVALGLEGVTDVPALEAVVGRVPLYKLGQLEKPLAAFKAAGVSKAVMAGKVQHVSLFGGVLPDLRSARLLARLRDKRTDTILKAVADEFAKEGIELLSSVGYLGHLLVGRGVQTARKPSGGELADARLGWRAAKALAAVDVGQTVVCGDGAVVSLEGMEGTDACVRRSGELARSQGRRSPLTVVKVAKPKQDPRFDIPVLGLDSLAVFAEAGVTSLALEADSTLIFDKPEFLKRADAQGLAIAGYPAEGPQ
ncbi:MAG: UDP-2,3-diacylglucosamine diphosphatase LpxI [Elusimicrobia bacterium]|nr:UDP-2,3-diacylglucosamine diphosphatase LpxI [Elusimicrobiota bacterium]MDE2237011.1 UDP-2,3-diacylglucosamine diphosphatase LpxI [Elusimicrobiota bacterium]MDE2424368.1 UDP-2,3-diacylglucosamine diphosphatase LpxI [Elusimicrobiota bacterium]